MNEKCCQLNLSSADGRGVKPAAMYVAVGDAIRLHTMGLAKTVRVDMP
jgi:hypothetical protein